MRKAWYWLAVLLVAACLVLPLAPRASAQEGVLVGRIAYTEGQILRFVPETRDWVATVKDAPFGMRDALYSDPQARAELIMPNGLWVRIGASTQIQLIALKGDASEIDLASGVTRFYNKSSNGVVKAATPFGYVLAEPDATFDLYVGDQSVEVLALRGDVAFIHQANNTRYDVLPGSSSIIANATEVASGDGTVDTAWDDWNAGRDRLWAQRVQVQGASIRHLPPQIQENAYVLEENGRWERVSYAGQYHEFWRPTTVAATWQPFTVGRWTEWYEDQTWVPDEPFGYVTHHYGNWVVVNGVWYWAPPVATVAVATGPLLGFAWYPGRVAWIHSEVDVGWVPLAPTEVYYSHVAWGPRAVLVTTVPTVSINIGGLAFAQAAVVVPQTALYSVPTYTSVRVTNINQTTIINNFQPAPVINQTVINNYNQVPNRYNFTNVNVLQKPYSGVLSRINLNQQIATQQAPTFNAGTLRQPLTGLRPATPVTQGLVPPPTVTNRLVPPSQVNAPSGQLQFPPINIKPNPKPGTASPAGQPAPGPRPGAPGPQPGQPPAPGGLPGMPGGATPRPGGPGPQPGQPAAPGGLPGMPGGATPRPGQPTPPVSPRPGAPGTPSGVPGIQSPRPGGQPPAVQPPAQPQPQPAPRPAPQAPPQPQPAPRPAPQAPPPQQPRPMQPPPQQQMQPAPRPAPQAPPQPQPRPMQPPQQQMQPAPRPAPQAPPPQQPRPGQQPQPQQKKPGEQQKKPGEQQ